MLVRYGTDSERLRSICTLQYRNWTKDFFTSVQPTFQGAPFVTRSVDMSKFVVESSASVPTFVPSTYSMRVDSGLPDDSVLKTSVVKVSGISANGSLNIPIHNIRAAFALDKLYRLQQQSGNGSYGEQIKNRFGFGGVHDDWKAVYLGGSSSPVSIGEVITTANTESTNGALGM